MPSEFIRNFNYYDSDEENAEYEEDDFETFKDKKYKTPDVETEENLDILEELLEDIATVEVLGLKAYKIKFRNNKIGDLENKNCQCEFDTREDGLPIIPEGGENYIIPYLIYISDIIDFFKGCSFETNIGTNFSI
jgi:hypothetical protein